MLMLMAFTGCTEFAIIASGSSIAISQNAYVKAYNGVDMLTIMGTEKSIKKHAYDKAKDAITIIKTEKDIKTHAYKAIKQR